VLYDCFEIRSNAILVKGKLFWVLDESKKVQVEDFTLKDCLNERNVLITPRKGVGMIIGNGECPQ